MKRRTLILHILINQNLLCLTIDIQLHKTDVLEVKSSLFILANYVLRYEELAINKAVLLRSCKGRKCRGHPDGADN